MKNRREAWMVRLNEFLAPREPATTEEEFADDLADYVAQLRGSLRGGGNHRKELMESGWLGLELPDELARREREWIAARLGRSVLARSLCWELGFDGVPFPNDTSAADALGTWALKQSELPESDTMFRLPRPQVSEPPLQGARRSGSVEPSAIFSTTPRVSGPEERRVALRRAARRLVEEAQRLSTRVGCDLQGALRWTLCGEQPKQACIRASATSRLGGPNTVSLEINADVVKPEEVRAIYRRLRRFASPIDEQVSVFLSPLAGNTRKPWKEKLVLWNETYPRRKFKNIPSFKTAAWRAKKKYAVALEPALMDRPTLPRMWRPWAPAANALAKAEKPPKRTGRRRS